MPRSSPSFLASTFLIFALLPLGPTVPKPLAFNSALTFPTSSFGMLTLNAVIEPFALVITFLKSGIKPPISFCTSLSRLLNTSSVNGLPIFCGDATHA